MNRIEIKEETIIREVIEDMAEEDITETTEGELEPSKKMKMRDRKQKRITLF